MEVLIFITSFLLSILAVSIFMNTVRKFLSYAGILGVDQQKSNKPRIPTSAGMVVIIGILTGIFFYIGMSTFILNTPVNFSYIFAGSFSILIITLVGFLDDIAMSKTPENNKGIKEYRTGLRQWKKALFVLPAAIPLMVVKAGTTSMSIPFIGMVNFGIIYPLIFIPIAVLCVANATNMLAGMNGLEAGMGAVAMLSLGLYAMLSNLVNSPEAIIISFSAGGALLAVLYWNKYPAKILPGDSLTYLIGAVIVTTVVLGNMEKFGIIIFTPWIIEAFLKLRSKFQARSLGDLQPDGTLKAPYKKIYSLTHVIMKIKPFKEWQITSILISIEVIISLTAFWLLLGA